MFRDSLEYTQGKPDHHLMCTVDSRLSPNIFKMHFMNSLFIVILELVHLLISFLNNKWTNSNITINQLFMEMHFNYVRGDDILYNNALVLNSNITIFFIS